MVQHKLIAVCVFISLISLSLSLPITLTTKDLIDNEQEIEKPEEIILEITTILHGGVKTKRQIKVGDNNNIEGIILNIGKINVNTGNGKSYDLGALLKG